MVEPVWLVCVLASYYLTLIRVRWNYLSAGVLVGIAYLIKPETLAYIVLYLIISFIQTLRKPWSLSPRMMRSSEQTFRALARKPRAFSPWLFIVHRKARNYSSYIIIVLVFVIAYSLWLYRYSGVLTFSGKSATVYWDSFIENNNLQQYELAYHLNDDFSVGYTIKNAWPVAIDLVSRLTINAKYFKQALLELFLPLKLTFIALVLAAYKLRARKQLLLALGILALPTLSALMFHIENRYLITLVLIVLFTLSLAITTANKGLIDKVASKVSLIALIVLTYYSYWPLKTELSSLVTERNKIKSDLAKFETTQKIVISTKPVYAYYLGKDYYPLPWEKTYSKYPGFITHYTNFILILDSWSRDTMPEVDYYIKTHSQELGLTQVKDMDSSRLTVFKKN